MTQSSITTAPQLADDLARLGVRRGDGPFVHASMRAIGPVVGGARSVVVALLDAVGDEGLIAMPAFSTDACPAAVQLGRDLTPDEADRLDAAVPGFDASLSPAIGMGAVAETFRTWPGTRRSTHPAVSVAMRGPDAERYVAAHALAFACGPGTPLHALMDRPRMKLLLLGVGWNRASALHTAETLIEPRRLKTRRFLDVTNGERTWRDTPDVADDGDRLFPAAGGAFEATGACRTGRVGSADTRLCSYRDLIAFGARWIGEANRRSGGRA